MIKVNLTEEGIFYVFNAGTLKIEWQIEPEEKAQSWTLTARWPSVTDTFTFDLKSDVSTLRKEIVKKLEEFVGTELKKKVEKWPNK